MSLGKSIVRGPKISDYFDVSWVRCHTRCRCSALNVALRRHPPSLNPSVPGRKWVQSSQRSPTGDPVATELTFPLHSGPSREFSPTGAITTRFSAVFCSPSVTHRLFCWSQVRQNSSSPTSLSFVDHMTHPKQLALKFVQVRGGRDGDRVVFFSDFQIIRCDRASLSNHSPISLADWPYCVKAGCPWKHQESRPWEEGGQNRRFAKGEEMLCLPACSHTSIVGFEIIGAEREGKNFICAAADSTLCLFLRQTVTSGDR